MKKVRYWIQDYFGFSPKETSGFLLLMCLIFSVLILPPIVKSLLPTKDTTEADRQKLDNLIASIESNSSVQGRPSPDPNTPNKLHLFNPNTASQKELEILGLEEKIVKRILKYRDKGGQFSIKNDFRKIYGLREEKFIELLPYIDLPDKKELSQKAHFSGPKNFSEKQFKPEKSSKPFDINTADSIQLVAINGIGNKLAKRIINYRSKLGGFTSLNQFYEIYGLDSVVVEKVKKSTFLSSTFIPKKININTCTLEELKSHPYISYTAARTIIAYRAQHGFFKVIEDLKKIHNIDAQTLIKLEPYLNF